MPNATSTSCESADAPYVKTKAAGVNNIGFLIDKAGKDCDPVQWLRELLKNSMEAIQRSGSATGNILIDVDEWYCANGQYKLTIIDDGDGMTAEEVVKYINNLSSSSATQTMDGNYGVGAKIAAATRNHAGVIYQTWKNGEGHMIQFWRNPRDGVYGLKALGTDEDGEEMYCGDISDEIKPKMIDQHGTKVILIGMTEDANTTIPPDTHTVRYYWIVKEANNRFFTIPSHIKLVACEGMENAQKEGLPHAGHHRVYGSKYFLDKSKIDSGVTPIEGAKVHWWVLPAREELKSDTPFYEVLGYTAALYQDELYERRTEKAGLSLLREFGITVGTKRVVICVEPTSKGLTTDTARTHLRLHDADLPWSDWADDFRNNLPEGLKAFMEAEAAKEEQQDFSKSCYDRIKQHLDLFKPVTYRQAKNGQHLIDPDLTFGKGTLLGGGGSGKGSKGGKGKGGGGTGSSHGDTKGVFSHFLKPKGLPSTKVKTDLIPNTRWVDPTDYGLEGRVALYNRPDNTILINKDFSLFKDMVKRFIAMGQWKNAPNVESIADAAVRGQYEQQITETVMGCLTELERYPETWKIEEERQAFLSPEALTAAVMARSKLYVSTKQAIASGPLGKCLDG